MCANVQRFLHSPEPAASYQAQRICFMEIHCLGSFKNYYYLVLKGFFSSHFPLKQSK
jgi:hypothetical protein